MNALATALLVGVGVFRVMEMLKSALAPRIPESWLKSLAALVLSGGAVYAVRPSPSATTVVTVMAAWGVAQLTYKLNILLEIRADNTLVEMQWRRNRGKSGLT